LAAVLADALDQNLAVGVRAAVADHLGRALTRAELTAARRAAHGLAALGRARVLHVAGGEADDTAGDRNYLVLAKPNVIMNDIRLRGLAAAGGDAAGRKSPHNHAQTTRNLKRSLRNAAAGARLIHAEGLDSKSAADVAAPSQMPSKSFTGSSAASIDALDATRDAMQGPSVRRLRAHLVRSTLSSISVMISRMASRVCWHCGAKTHMSLNGEPQLIEWSTDARGQAVLMCGLFLCDECRRPSVGLAIRTKNHTSNVSAWLKGDLQDKPKIIWLPANAIGRDFPDVPEHIASAASEAYECHSIGAHRAAGAMARAVIEATAKDKRITKGPLIDKIEEMARQDLIRPHIRDAAHEVRHLGNDMAHGDFIDPIDETETAETLELISEILNEVYQSPAKIARRRAARQAKATAKDHIAA
jgi:hypothetical protein